MKRFVFELARVRDFRRQQLEVEEAKLQSLITEHRALECEAARIDAEASATRLSLMVTGSAESQDLKASDRYLRHLAAAGKRQIAKLAEWQTRAVKQREVIVEARRRVRLMEQLEEKRFSEWKKSVDREQEKLSSELFLARWKRS